MIILAIDPGTNTSGAVLYASETKQVLWSEQKVENPDMRLMLLRGAVPVPGTPGWDVVAVERVQATGLAGNDIIKTAEWSATFREAARGFADTSWHYRREVCRHLGVSGGGKDAQVRARCIELHGGDRKTAQGTKKAPGPLHGVAGHSWQALGLALLVADL